MSETASRAAIEQYSIEHIPEDERYGTARSLFPVWFAANMQVTPVVVGALGVLVGLPLPAAILALVIGNVLGAVLMALHSAQGPKLGIPQMIQSRAQFGHYGAIVPLILVLLMYLGFYSFGTVLGGQALASWWGTPFWLSALVMSAIITAFTIFGYHVIHRLQRVVSVLTALTFAFLTIRLFTEHSVGTAWNAGGDVPLGTFLLVVSIAATWQITYSPYVADYSRYLPSSTSIRAAFWWTYAGSVLATVWMMSLGSFAAAMAPEAFAEGSSDFIVGLAPDGMGGVIFAVIALGLIGIQVLNLYGMFMSSATTVTALKPLRIGTPTRSVFILAAAAIGTTMGILGRGDFVTNFENFILFLAYFLIPWTGINLVDFYWVRKEKYDMESIFDINGIYGRVNWRTMTAYVAAVLVAIPFASTTFYTGPLVEHLGGADIAWILATVVAGGLYLLLVRPTVGEEGAHTEDAVIGAAR